MFLDNDERGFLVTIGGSSTAPSGVRSVRRVGEARGGSRGTRASRRDNGWNGVAWLGRLCDEGNHRLAEPVAAAPRTAR